jgi:hypothetical protein
VYLQASTATVQLVQLPDELPEDLEQESSLPRVLPPPPENGSEEAADMTGCV